MFDGLHIGNCTKPTEDQTAFLMYKKLRNDDMMPFAPATAPASEALQPLACGEGVVGDVE